MFACFHFFSSLNRDAFIHLCINLHCFPRLVNLEHSNMYRTFFPVLFLSEINSFLHCDICFHGFITFTSIFSKLSLILNKNFNGQFYPVPGHVLLFCSVIPSDRPTKASRTGGSFLVKNHAVTSRTPQPQSGYCHEHPHCSCHVPSCSPVFSLAMGHICTL